MLIERICGHVQDYELDGLEVDTGILDHEELTRPHQKIKTTNGRDIAISLPRGEHLYFGAVLYKDDKVIIYVEMADENLLEIFPSGNIEWGRAAFNIGNMHHPAYMNDDSIITPYDPAIERIFKALNIKYEQKVGKLTGVRANVNQLEAHEHSHSHGGHNHSHDGHSHSHDGHSHSHDGHTHSHEGHSHE